LDYDIRQYKLRKRRVSLMALSPVIAKSAASPLAYVPGSPSLLSPQRSPLQPSCFSMPKLRSPLSSASQGRENMNASANTTTPRSGSKLAGASPFLPPAPRRPSVASSPSARPPRLSLPFSPALPSPPKDAARKRPQNPTKAAQPPRKRRAIRVDS